MFQEVGEPGFTVELLSVVVQPQAAVEKGVVPETVLDVLLAPVVVAEDLGIGDEPDQGAVRRLRVRALLLLELLAAAEYGSFELAFPIADESK